MKKAGLSVLLACSLIGAAQSTRLSTKTAHGLSPEAQNLQVGELLFSGNVQMMCMSGKQSGKAGHLSLNCELQQNKPTESVATQVAASTPATTAAVQTKAPPTVMATPAAAPATTAAVQVKPAPVVATAVKAEVKTEAKAPVATPAAAPAATPAAAPAQSTLT